jgi:hypothetical protein
VNFRTVVHQETKTCEEQATTYRLWEYKMNNFVLRTAKSQLNCTLRVRTRSRSTTMKEKVPDWKCSYRSQCGGMIERLHAALPSAVWQEIVSLEFEIALNCWEEG